MAHLLLLSSPLLHPAVFYCNPPLLRLQFAQGIGFPRVNCVTHTDEKIKETLMKLLKILFVGFLVVLLLFVTFRMMTAPSPDGGIVAIIIASSLAGMNWNEGQRNRCFLRFRRNE
jgi:hypothetical protein